MGTFGAASHGRSRRDLNVSSVFSVPCFAIVARLALELLRFVEGRKLKNGTACIAVVLGVSCGVIPNATAAGRALDYASVHRQSITVILARARRGDPAAETRLGWLYSTGRGVPQDYAEAAKWFYRAATHGNADAQFALGMAYNKGQGVSRDYVLSYLWLNLSAAQAVGADRDFKTTLRDAIASKMTPRQLLTAQQLALKWAKLN